MEEQSKEISLLRQKSIMEAVDRAITQVPPDKKGKISIEVTGKEADVTFTYKVGDNFSAGGFVRYNGKIDGGGRITWEW